MASNIPAEAHGLGTPTAEYTSNIIRQAFSLVVSAILTIMGVVAILHALSAALSGGSDALLFSGLGLVYALPGALWFISTIRKRGLRVLVFPAGLSLTKGGKTEIIRWDDVEIVRQTIRKNQYTTFTAYSCTVQLHDGSKYTFNNALRNVDQLISTIQQESTHRILSRVSEAYDAGQTIPFGKLSVSKAGISKGNNTLPWDQVKGVTVNNGVVTIKKQGSLFKWTSVTVAETPNFYVFAYVVGSTAPGSTDLVLLAMSVTGSAQGGEK